MNEPTKKMEDSKNGTAFVITGLMHMIEEEGLTTRQAFEILEDIKHQTYFTLKEIEKEAREKNE